MANYVNGDITNAKIVNEDGNYFVINEGIKGEALKTHEYQGRTILTLTENDSNRKYFDKAKVDEAIKANGELVLTYKATVKIGSSTRVPNEKLIAFLNEADRAEYDAIIARAKAAMEAAKPKPLTEVEKIQARIAKLNEKLEAELAKVDESTDETSK